MRLSKEELDKICKELGVDTLWSFSRFDAWRNSKYEWFLKYIKKEVPNGEVSPYGILGGEVHDLIQGFYENQIKFENLADEFDTVWATNIDMLDYKFNRSDEEMNKSIKKKYYENILEFFKNYKRLPYKIACEKFATIKVTDDIIFQGYIDATYKDDDGYYNIVDWKTSTKYTGKAIEEHSHQLVLYAEALRQMGISADKIKICWCFIKYVTIKQEQVNGKITESIVERRDIGQKLSAKIRLWGKKLGYAEDEVDTFVNNALVDNGIDSLPDDISCKFSIEDAYVYVDNWEKIWEELKEEIINTVAEINDIKQKYDKTGDEKLWWDDDESLRKQSYYLSQLSEFSIEQILPYKFYLEKLEKEKKENNDLLGDLKNDDEMEWLNNI